MTITDILIKYFTSRFSLNQNEVKFLINEWNASFTCHHKKKKKKHLVKDKLCFLNELTFLQRNNRFVAVARMIILNSSEGWEQVNAKKYTREIIVRSVVE